MRIYFAAWRGFPGKCRSRGVESNSDPRSLPLPGREPPPAATSPGEEVTQVSAAPAFASVGEALEMVRAGLGYLAAADAAQLPAATQAECLRELEQTDASRHRGAGLAPGRVHRRGGARRGRGLQRRVLADPPDRDHPGRRGRAQRVGQAGGHPPAGNGRAGGGAGLGVRRAGDLPVDRQAPARTPGRGGRATAGRVRRGPGAGATWRRCSRRCTCGPAGTCPIRTGAGSSRTGR